MAQEILDVLVDWIQESPSTVLLRDYVMAYHHIKITMIWNSYVSALLNLQIQKAGNPGEA